MTKQKCVRTFWTPCWNNTGLFWPLCRYLVEDGSSVNRERAVGTQLGPFLFTSFQIVTINHKSSSGQTERRYHKLTVRYNYSLGLSPGSTESISLRQPTPTRSSTNDITCRYQRSALSPFQETRMFKTWHTHGITNIIYKAQIVAYFDGRIAWSPYRLDEPHSHHHKPNTIENAVLLLRYIPHSTKIIGTDLLGHF